MYSSSLVQQSYIPELGTTDVLYQDQGEHLLLKTEVKPK